MVDLNQTGLDFDLFSTLNNIRILGKNCSCIQDTRERMSAGSRTLTCLPCLLPICQPNIQYTSAIIIQICKYGINITTRYCVFIICVDTSAPYLTSVHQTKKTSESSLMGGPRARPETFGLFLEILNVFKKQ